jgi:hypothetical protein
MTFVHLETQDGLATVRLERGKVNALNARSWQRSRSAPDATELGARQRRERVRAPRRAAADRARRPRRAAAERACLDRAFLDAARRPSRRSARLVARPRRFEGDLAFRLFWPTS